MIQEFVQAEQIQVETKEEFYEIKGFNTKALITREINKLDDEIIRLHRTGYRCKRHFMATPHSELLKLRRSLLYAKLCDLEREMEI